MVYVTHIVIFQVKNCYFEHWELVLTLLKSYPAFYPVIIPSFLNFPPIPQICSAEPIRGIGGNF